MNWHSLDEFLYMGGYGLYVWGAYLLTVLCVAVELAMLRLGRGGADAGPRTGDDE
jgi:heme exporter protein D